MAGVDESAKARPMNILRRWRLVNGKAKDHKGECVLVENPTFDVNKTIFRTMKEKVSQILLFKI